MDYCGRRSEQTLRTVESRVDQLLSVVQPSTLSETKRRHIIRHVCNIIADCFKNIGEVEAWVFGSVPLKAYLPDGDIDLSIFPGPGCEDSALPSIWAPKLLARLQREQSRPSGAVLRLQGTHIVQAELRLLKCVVDDVVVDISFGALGGLCTAAFLESMDRSIGRDHLFKRSILLIKAWCFYEGRLLGAHHGLISSYALETMVLHVLHRHPMPHVSPLRVFHRFLEVFSEFDWDANCLTLDGPVPLADIVEGGVSAEGTKLSCLPRDLYRARSVSSACSPGPSSSTRAAIRGRSHPLATPPPPPPPPPRLVDPEALAEAVAAHRLPRPGGAFAARHLNVLDPLQAGNNLGRSVSRAACARVRLAMSLGLRQLEEALAAEPGRALALLDRLFRWSWQAPSRAAAGGGAEAGWAASAPLLWAPPAWAQPWPAREEEAGWELSWDGPRRPVRSRGRGGREGGGFGAAEQACGLRFAAEQACGMRFAAEACGMRFAVDPRFCYEPLAVQSPPPPPPGPPPLPRAPELWVAQPSGALVPSGAVFAPGAVHLLGALPAGPRATAESLAGDLAAMRRALVRARGCQWRRLQPAGRGARREGDAGGGGGPAAAQGGRENGGGRPGRDNGQTLGQTLDSPASCRPGSEHGSSTSLRPDSASSSFTSLRPDSANGPPTSLRPNSASGSLTCLRPESTNGPPTGLRPDSANSSLTSLRPESTNGPPTSPRPDSSPARLSNPASTPRASTPRAPWPPSPAAPAPSSALDARVSPSTASPEAVAASPPRAEELGRPSWGILVGAPCADPGRRKPEEARWADEEEFPVLG